MKVKHSVHTVHGHQELAEKVGRHDLQTLPPLLPVLMPGFPSSWLVWGGAPAWSHSWDHFRWLMSCCWPCCGQCWLVELGRFTNYGPDCYTILLFIAHPPPAQSNSESIRPHPVRGHRGSW